MDGYRKIPSEIFTTDKPISAREAIAQIGEVLGLDDRAVVDLFPALKSYEGLVDIAIPPGWNGFILKNTPGFITGKISPFHFFYTYDPERPEPEKVQFIRVSEQN